MDPGRHVRAGDGRGNGYGRIYDLVIVGGGFSGTIAAYTFLKETGRQRRCLLLDNHPIIGGEAKRNEFCAGPATIRPARIQWGGVPAATGDPWRLDMWKDIGLPTQSSLGNWRRTASP